VGKITGYAALATAAGNDVMPIVDVNDTSMAVSGTTKQITVAHLLSNVSLTPTAIQTSVYSAAAGDFVPCDTTSAAFTVTLPAAPADKSQVAIKIVTLGAGNFVTVACAGSDVINKAGGSTTYTLRLSGQAVLLQYNYALAVWYILADDLSLTQLDARYALGTGSGVYPLDSYTGTDDQKMTSALADVVAAGGGTIVLGARAHTFTLPWLTTYVNNTTTLALRIAGQGAAYNGQWSTPSGATTCDMQAAGVAAKMNFQRLGSVEISGIYFKDTTGSAIPFLLTTNATLNIHDNVFAGSKTGTACDQDAIRLGGATAASDGGYGGGDNARFQGYSSQIYRNYFHQVRAIVTFGVASNSNRVYNNTVSSSCGSLYSGCIVVNDELDQTNGNLVDGNCVEICNYKYGVDCVSGAQCNTFGPNGWWDSNTKTVAIHHFSARGLMSNQFNPVIAGYQDDARTFVLDSTGNNPVYNYHQSTLSVQYQAVRNHALSVESSFYSAPRNYDNLGNIAYLKPATDAANSYAAAQVCSTVANWVNDASLVAGSKYVTSLTAAFASTLGPYTNDMYVPIYLGAYMAGIIEATYTAATAPAWIPGAVITLGDIARPTTANAHMYQCTTAGTTNATTQPTWPTGGGTVTDGTVVWTDIGAATAAFVNATNGTGSTTTVTGATCQWGRGSNTQYAMTKFSRHHIISTGSAPSWAIGTTCIGTAVNGATAVTAGTDLAQQVTITTASSGTAPGVMATSTAALAFSVQPRVSLTPKNAATAALCAAGVWVTTATNGAMTINCAGTPVISTPYVFDIVAIQ